MAQDIDQLIPEGAKQDLEDVSKLWDDIVTKVTGYVKEVQKISISPDASRTLISMDESLAKIAESTRRYEKALQDIAVAQQRAADAAAKLTSEKEKGERANQEGIKRMIAFVEKATKLKEGVGGLVKGFGALRAAGATATSVMQFFGGQIGAILKVIELAFSVFDEFTDKVDENKVSAAEATDSYRRMAGELDQLAEKYSRVSSLMEETSAMKGLRREIELLNAQGAPAATILKKEIQLRKEKLEALDKEKKEYQAMLAESLVANEHTTRNAIGLPTDSWDKKHNPDFSVREQFISKYYGHVSEEEKGKMRLDFFGFVTRLQKDKERVLGNFDEARKEIQNQMAVLNENYKRNNPINRSSVSTSNITQRSEVSSNSKSEENDAEAKRLQQMEAAKKLEQQLRKEQLEGRAEYVEELEKYNKRLAQDEINALTEKYGKGKMSEEKYQQGVNEIKLKYATQNLDQSISFLQEELNTAQLSADEKIAIEEHIADLRVKSEEMANEKIIKSRQKMEKMMKDVSKALEEAAVAMYKGIMDSNIKNIEETQKAADRKKEEDIANVEASVGNEEEKQARIAGINASYEARKTALENQKKQQERKKAEFERALAISKAIYEGASAVVEALPNIPLSVSIGLIAAANIAKMLATPLPGYYKGTDHAAPGLAWVGERGTEAIISKDGSVSLTPDGPTLAYMHGGEQVIPNHLLDGFLMPQLYGQELKPKSGSFNTQKLERKLDAVERAIKNKPVANFHIADGAIRKSIIAGNSKYHYLKKHII